MRALLFFFLLATAALTQSAPQTYISHTTESLRGVSAVSKNIAWASGTHGTYLRTTNGRTWISAQVPDAATLDFRAVVAFSADEAFLMSAGPGDQSRIYHTTDAGQHWTLQFTNPNPKGFFDSMVFWDPTHGIVLGDPIPDETGKQKFELLLTTNGQSWTHIPPAQLPPAIEGEGAFAASNTCLAILPSPVILSGDTRTAKRTACRSRRTPCTSPPPQTPLGVLTADAPPPNLVIPISQRFVTPGAQSIVIEIPQNSVIPSAARDLGSAAATAAPVVAQPPPGRSETNPAPPDSNIWFATGGRAARVFHSPDRGHTWEVFDTPILHGPDSAGIFSIAFRDPLHGVIAGGDYKHPTQDGPNLAFTSDGGKTWTLSQIFPQSYYSAVTYDRKYDRKQNGRNETQSRLFIAGPKFIYDFRPPQNPTRISPSKKSGMEFNALSPYPDGGTLAVGPKGSLATIP